MVRAVRAKAEVTGRARVLTGKLAALAAGLSWLVAERSPGASVVTGTGTRRAPSKGHKGGHHHELAHQRLDQARSAQRGPRLSPDSGVDGPSLPVLRVPEVVRV